ncbi:MAG: peptidyl-prolyl cis-trans isomerase [Solirubrobacterales bacterium]|nr:peptidyl-prolyl cis-trans isomerase [Solirubrobacterales bacterium]
MPKPVRVLIVFSSMLLVLLSSGGCASDSSEAIARVGSMPITSAALRHWMSVGAAMSPSTARVLLRDVPEQIGLKQRMLSFLLSSARVIGEARAAHIVVSDAAVSAVLERLQFAQRENLSLQPDLQRLITIKAETPSDRLWLLKIHMLNERLEQRNLSQAEQRIARPQLVSYYATHRRDFLMPERRDVAVIETFHKKEAEIARREIDSGRDLLQVVQLRNEEAAVGGLKRGLTRPALRHEYEENYFNAPSHTLVGPLRAEIYYLFEVTAIMPARLRTFAEAEPIIRRELIVGSQRHLLESVKYALAQRWRAETKCRAAYKSEQCGGGLT